MTTMMMVSQMMVPDLKALMMKMVHLIALVSVIPKVISLDLMNPITLVTLMT